MGLFDFIKSIFGGSSPSPLDSPQTQLETTQDLQAPSPQPVKEAGLHRPQRTNVSLRPLDYRSSLERTSESIEIVRGKPYPFAFPGARTGEYLDLSQDGDERWLEYYGLPSLHTPQQLANWLEVSIGTLAWLTHRSCESRRPENTQKAHYSYKWLKKRSGALRLIESPKPMLKEIQRKILREILEQVPAHPKAHGFVKGRSIVTNARPHVRKRFVLKFDLEDFYPSVRYSRVVAIFRSLGFSREVAIWLARLTTTAVPWNLERPDNWWHSNNWRYWSHHLPQGAPTSPALANLSAYGLDVRLSGLAERYNLSYTRYADDLTFSGLGKSIPALKDIIPLVTKIIRNERFAVNFDKRKVFRNNQQQNVTGVVVNQRPNVSRQEFDRLKAILHNSVKHGPASQNREQLENFDAHLLGRIAHVTQLNAQRGQKLLELYQQIEWSR